MFRSSPFSGLLHRVVPLLALLALVTAPLAAQGYTPPPLQHTQFGIGYAGNLPDLQAGGSAYVLLPRWGGVGLYVDAKFGIGGPSSERGYEADVTATQIEDEIGGTFVKEEAEWWSANAAVMYVFSPYLTLYGGGGIAHVSPYRLYNVDRTLDVGAGGVVWARDTRGDDYRPNLMLGMITRLTSRVSAQIGYETEPDGVTAGLSLRLPRW